MNLKKLSDSDLLKRMSKLVRTERKIMHLVLQCIAEVDARKIYLRNSYPSLYEFLIQDYGYSPSAAYRRMEGARLLREIPEVAKKVEAGALNLSQMTMVRQAVRNIERTGAIQVGVDEKRALLQKIEFLSQKKTEQVLAQEYGLMQNPIEKERQHRNESVSLTIQFSKEQMEILERARNLVDHAVAANGWADAITYFAKGELKKRTGTEVKTGKSQSQTTQKNQALRSESSSMAQEKRPSKEPFSKSQRAPIPQHLRKKMFQSHRGCEFVNPITGRRCASLRFLEIDHIQPISAGGDNTESNLRILCAFHNRYRHLTSATAVR